jgi:hypothetical protein
MTKHQKLEVAVAIVLVLCVGLVAAWMIAAKLAARPFDELRLKAEDFEGFSPRSDMWSIRLIHVKASPTEPTVIAYLLKRPDHRLPTSDLRPPTSGLRPPTPEESVLSRVGIPTLNQFLPHPGLAVVAVVQVNFHLAVPITAECGQAVQAADLVFIPGIEEGVARWHPIGIPEPAQGAMIITAPVVNLRPGGAVTNAPRHRAVR